MDAAEISNRFAFHPATAPERQEAHTIVRERCATLAGSLDDLLPDGREKDIAIAKIEEAMFWANAAVARQN